MTTVTDKADILTHKAIGVNSTHKRASEAIKLSPRTNLAREADLTQCLDTTIRTEKSQASRIRIILRSLR